MADFVDYYACLGVECSAEVGDIKKAYRKQALLVTSTRLHRIFVALTYDLPTDPSNSSSSSNLLHLY
jgi:hypothetical protein